MDHFQGKTVPQHLKEARVKGAKAKAEAHGLELSGHLAALTDSGKDSAISLLILWAFLSQTPFSHDVSFLLLAAFSLGWLLWKTGRSALLGWSRLERLHRVTEEERFEIEHHREQERAELTEIYQAKGFSGKLLTDAVDVLMADDNRLLTIMLEEELGLSLESYEHPLKQSFGAFAGTLLSTIILLLTFYFFPGFHFGIAALLIVGATSFFGAKLEGNQTLPACIWNMSMALFAGLSVYFLTNLAFSL